MRPRARGPAGRSRIHYLCNAGLYCARSRCNRSRAAHSAWDLRVGHPGPFSPRTGVWDPITHEVGGPAGGLYLPGEICYSARMRRKTLAKPTETPLPPVEPAPKDKRGGRRRKVTGRELLVEICSRVATGETLTAIAKEPGMPTPPKFRAAIALDPGLQDLWELAKNERPHALFEEAVDLARELTAGRWGKDETNVVRAKQIAIDALRTAAARLNPREYGERQTGKVVVPVQINTTLSLRGKPAPDPVAQSYSYAIEPPSEEGHESSP